MELFGFIFFFVIINALTAVVRLNFFHRFSGCTIKKYHYCLCILLTYGLSFLYQLLPSHLFSTVIEILMLILFGITVLKVSVPGAVLTSILAESVLLLAFGMFNSITSILSPLLISITPRFSSYMGIASAILSLFLTCVGYRIIERNISFDKSIAKQYVVVFLLPALLVLLVCEYVSGAIYGNVILMEPSGVVQPGVNHFLILFLHVFVCLILSSTLYACQKLSEGFRAKTQLVLLEQEAHTQREYLHEAWTRYEQTQIFRHDLKNHLLILDGLLYKKDTEQARAYLNRLEEVSAELSFFCKTGSAAVDTLLGSKLSLAGQNGIRVECSVKIPSCSLDDLDLCIVFANALDNALKACHSVDEKNRYIRICGSQKNDFFMLEIENSRSPDGSYEKGSGIGLLSIKAVAEKYHGAVTTEEEADFFQLNVLFIISRHLSDISVKTY